MLYEMPGKAGAKVQFKAKYDNFIGGKFVAPLQRLQQGHPRALPRRSDFPVQRKAPSREPLPHAKDHAEEGERAKNDIQKHRRC